MRKCGRLFFVVTFLSTVLFLVIYNIVLSNSLMQKSIGFLEKLPMNDGPIYSTSNPISAHKYNTRFASGYANVSGTNKFSKTSSDDYFVPSKRIITKYDYDFIIEGDTVCQDFQGNNYSPTVVVLILSVWDHKPYRDGIRATWASGRFPEEISNVDRDSTHKPKTDTYELFNIAKEKEKHSIGSLGKREMRMASSNYKEKPPQLDQGSDQSNAVNHGPWRKLFRHVFLLGIHEKRDGSLESLRKESAQYGDIIVGDFMDSYFNLTLKVILGFHWASKYCPQATHLVKIDEDTFLHLPRLYHRILLPKWNSTISGRLHHVDPVKRSGKYAVVKEAYPLPFYPAHVKGNIYWMPAKVARKIARVAPYMPYVNMEDAFITGILAKVVEVHHSDLEKDDYSSRPMPPDACAYRKTKKIASQQTSPTLAQRIWKTLLNDSLCR